MTSHDELRPRSVLVVAWWMLGCGQVEATTTDAMTVAAPDAALATADAARVCDPRARFGPPMLLTGFAERGSLEGTARLSADELTMYFSARLVGTAGYDLYAARRNTVTEPFASLAPLTAQNSAFDEYDPTVSEDGLTLWFVSGRVAGEGFHIHVATRTSTLAEFGAPGLALGLNSADPLINDIQPFITADRKELWFSSNRPAGGASYEIWRSRDLGAGFTEPMRVAELSSTASDELPLLSADRRTIYFTSNRGGPGTLGANDIWTSHRADAGDGFPTPTPVGELNSTDYDQPTWLSRDNCRLYMDSLRHGDLDLFMATRQP